MTDAPPHGYDVAHGNTIPTNNLYTTQNNTTQTNTLTQDMSKKAETKIVNAERKMVKKILAVTPKPTTPVIIVKPTKQSMPENSRRRATKKAFKDVVMQDYLRAIIDPDGAEDIRIPDGFPIHTATVKSVQTIDVIANHNTDSITNGDGGRFFFQVAPNIGSGSENNNSYSLQSNTYLNIGRALNETSAEITLATKAAGALPTAVWNPGFLVDPTPMLSKKAPKSTVPPTLPLKKSRAQRMHKRGLESDSQFNSMEFWHDPVQARIAGDVTNVEADMVEADQGGAATMIRPVAMSVWFECTKSELDSGGDVAAALLPSGSTMGQIIPLDFNEEPPVFPATYGGWTGYGPLQNYENLAAVPGSYQGKLKDGTYTYWVPQRVNDMDMNTPARQDLYDFPSIVVAGQWAPNGGHGGLDATSYKVGRLRIVTHYEYVSCQQDVALKLGAVTSDPLSKLKLLLHGQPTSMANGHHLSWIKKLLGVAAGALTGFLTGGPAGAFAGGVTGFELGTTWANNT